MRLSFIKWFTRHQKTGGFLVILLLLGLSTVFSQEVSYDRYAAIFKKPQTPPSFFKTALPQILTFPFEFIRWPVDKSLVYIEKHKIDTKLRWMYDTLVDHGVTPYGKFGTVDNLGIGADMDFIRLAELKEDFPDATLRGWVQWNHHVNFEIGSEMGLRRIADSSFYTLGFIQYENRPEEHFYGLGPDSSRGEGTSFRMEDTGLRATIGYNPIPSFDGDLYFSYHNVNITNGEDGGRGIIDRTFFPQQISGLQGDELMTVGSEFTHDTRNYKENSTLGGLQRLGFSFHEGLYGSDARYIKIEAEASHYWALGSERRVGVFHFYGEHNNEAEDHYVPFHQMAKLGGYGMSPRLSHALRGYDFNRFFGENAALFNIEYRYAIWEYRELRTDAVLFWDEGQVFGNFSDFQMKDFRESYGGGFRVSIAKVVVFLIEAAHGDEGTNLYVKTGTSF